MKRRSPLAPPPPSNRFKVQRRVEIKARDAADNPFIVGEIWNTIAQASTQPAAEQVYKAWCRDQPHGSIRLVEERPFGMGPRVLLPAPPHKTSPRTRT